MLRVPEGGTLAESWQVLAVAEGHLDVERIAVRLAGIGKTTQS